MKDETPNSPDSPPEPLRVLFIEHDKDDVDLCVDSLRRAGFDPVVRVVASKEEFLQALCHTEFDVVISDFRLPEWTGMEALDLLLQDGRDIPFILVTGWLGDESAVECIKRGVTDYVLKDRLARLPEAVRRALEEKSLREERARIEQALRLSEQRYRTLMETAPDAIFIIDKQSIIQYTNPAASRIFGYPVEELLGKPLTLLMPASHRDLHLHGMWRYLETRKKQMRWDCIEFPGLHRDGREIPLEISVGEFLHNGRHVFTGIVRDISERFQAEAERMRLITAIEQTTEGVLITDMRGAIQYVNPAFVKMTGYSREEVVGQNPRLLQSGIHDTPFYEQLWKTVLAGKTWHGEIVNRRKDGTLYTEEMSITPVRDAGGQVTHFIAIKQDITQRRTLEQQLRQAQKFEAIGQLIGGIAHDFNNVIGAILGWAEMGLDEVPPDSRAHSYFKKTRAQADRAAALIRQLLAFARRQILEPRNLSINHSVADLTSMLESVLGKDIEIKSVLAPDLAIVRADPTQIEQVLLNLCINARDAMPGGGRLVIETENVDIDDEYCRLHPYSRPGRYVRLTVSDSGTGMDAATLEHIFEPFFTTKEPGRGTGLGLATAFGIVKQHGGFLHVYSELGHGSVFHIYFPAVEAKPDLVSKPEEEAARGGSETILLAENHEGLRETARSTLEKLGYRVLPVPEGAAAVDLFRSQPDTIDLALLDVVMPHLNGPEAYALMEVLRPGLPVVFTSGYTAETPAFTEAQKRGLPILPKPYSPSQLARKVREALDRRLAPTPSSRRHR